MDLGASAFNDTSDMSGYSFKSVDTVCRPGQTIHLDGKCHFPNIDNLAAFQQSPLDKPQEPVLLSTNYVYGPFAPVNPF